MTMESKPRLDRRGYFFRVIGIGVIQIFILILLFKYIYINIFVLKISYVLLAFGGLWALNSDIGAKEQYVGQRRGANQRMIPKKVLQSKQIGLSFFPFCQSAGHDRTLFYFCYLRRDLEIYIT